jgi:hypothetical protein
MRIFKPSELYSKTYDTAGASLYLTIERDNEVMVWSTATSALAAGTTLANAAIAMTENLRVWSVAIPAALPKGRYMVRVFVKAGTDPANTDEKISSEIILVSDH